MGAAICRDISALPMGYLCPRRGRRIITNVDAENTLSRWCHNRMAEIDRINSEADRQHRNIQHLLEELRDRIMDLDTECEYVEISDDLGSEEPVSEPEP